MEGSGGTYRVGAPGRGSSRPEVQDAETQQPSLSLGTCGVALIQPFTGLRRFWGHYWARGKPLLSGARVMGLEGIRSDKRGAGTCAPRVGKRTEQMVCIGGGSEGRAEVTAKPGRRGLGEAVACWGPTPETGAGGQWGFDGGLWTGAGGVFPFQGSVESKWALLLES